MGRVFLREDEILKAGIFAKLSESPISLFYDRNKFQLFLLIKTTEKIKIFTCPSLIKKPDTKKKAAHSKNVFWPSKNEFLSN